MTHTSLSLRVPFITYQNGMKQSPRRFFLRIDSVSVFGTHSSNVPHTEVAFWATIWQ
ncbi:MAG: hypothetical protein HY960_13320 [Ignavibacteriae bacterium]|nr:hypothetical protein [Ignavibacteriota bacterium]